MKVINGIFLTLLMGVLGFSTISQAATDPIFSLGTGLGEATVRSDTQQDFTHSVVELGIDYESERILFQFLGYVSRNNTFSDLRLLAGYGNRYIKLGTGLMGMQSSIPTASGNLFLLPTDPDRLTDVSATTVPLFLRIHPYRSDNLIITLDGYYGLYTQGSLAIPLKIGGKIKTESRQSHGRFGVGGSLLWRLPAIPRLGLKLAYAVHHGTMDPGSTTVIDDVFGLIPPIPTPNLTFETRTLMLSVVVFGKE